MTNRSLTLQMISIKKWFIVKIINKPDLVKSLNNVLKTKTAFRSDWTLVTKLNSMKIKIVFSVYDNVDHHAYTTQKFKIEIVLLSHGET